MYFLNGCSVSKQVWHAKEPSLLIGHECPTTVKICSPYQQWWRLQMSENSRVGQQKNPKNKYYILCQAWLKWVQHRTDYKKSWVTVITFVTGYFPLELRVWPFFWTKFLFTQKCINSMIMKKSHRKSLSFYCCKHFSPVSLLSPIRKWCCKFALPSPKHGFRCVGANINWYKLAQIDWFLWERIGFF